MYETWNKTKKLMALIIAVSSFSVAQAGNSKGKPKEEVLHEAGAVEFSDAPGDAILSDGTAYVDGVDGTECIHGEPPTTVRCNVGPTRGIGVVFGTCLSEDCHDPFGGTWSGTLTGGVLVDTDPFRSDEDAYWRWPDAGETCISEDSVWGSSHLNIAFCIGDRRYFMSWYGPNGEIQATGYDDDGDGVRDRVVMTASGEAIVRLWETVPSREGVGKKSDRTVSELRGEFIGMPFTATFHSLGYLRTRPGDFK